MNLRYILLIAALYMLYTMFMSEKRKKAAARKAEEEQLVKSGELVKDPQCGAYVEKDSALTVRDGETVHYFCSYECRDAFLQKNTKELPKNDGNTPK